MWWDTPSGQESRAYADPGRLRARSPQSEREPCQVRDLGRVVYLFGDTGREHAPAGVIRAVNTVALERDPALASPVQLRPRIGAQHDRAPIEREVHREHERAAVVVHDGDPTEAASGQQGQTLVPIEDLEPGPLLDFSHTVSLLTGLVVRPGTFVTNRAVRRSFAWRQPRCEDCGLRAASIPSLDSRHCCVELDRTALQLRAVDVGSDRSGELGERDRDALIMSGVDAEFVVASTDVSRERVPADDHACGVVAFESTSTI